MPDDENSLASLTLDDETDLRNMQYRHRRPYRPLPTFQPLQYPTKHPDFPYKELCGPSSHSSSGVMSLSHQQFSLHMDPTSAGINQYHIKISKYLLNNHIHCRVRNINQSPSGKVSEHASKQARDGRDKAM